MKSDLIDSRPVYIYTYMYIFVYIHMGMYIYIYIYIYMHNMYHTDMYNINHIHNIYICVCAYVCNVM